MKQPLVCEINTRCWLRELSARLGRAVSLASVPDSVLEAWRKPGFTHVWLMGVWPTGPRSRAAALSSQGMRRAFSEALPDWQDDDVAGSPFAVADYATARELGGVSALREFRKKLHAHGLKLLLDFVPNHLGLDHPWVNEKPELFVEAPLQRPETFPVETGIRPSWLAHGKVFSSKRKPAAAGWRTAKTRTSAPGSTPLSSTIAAPTLAPP